MLVGLLILSNERVFLGEESSQLSFQETPPEDNIILPSADFLLGQNFIVGIPDKILDKETKNFLQQIRPAGVILYSRNYQTRDQLINLITELQELAKATTDHYYFIMIDEEPGGATRLNLFKNVFAFGFPEWDRIERDIREMSSAGINVNLAPLADFPFNEDTFIKRRIQAHTPAALTDFNREFITLHQKNNISATLKHFPGMGVFIDDPHKKIPYISGDQKVIDESIKIFKDGIDADVNFVMTGHAIYNDIDPGIPATLSKKIVTDMLRNELGFEGIIITDDISDMPLIVGTKMNLTEATAESLRAGHNLVIFSHRPRQTLELLNRLLQELETDQELRYVVENNYKKITEFKKNILAEHQGEIDAY